MVVEAAPEISEDPRSVGGAPTGCLRPASPGVRFVGWFVRVWLLVPKTEPSAEFCKSDESSALSDPIVVSRTG